MTFVIGMLFVKETRNSDCVRLRIDGFDLGCFAKCQ